MQSTVRTGGQALVDALARHGVDVVFGIPGTHNLSIYAALAESGIEHVSPRHEQGAGYGADGYARVSGRPGVCITTTGPAILNAAAAAAQAYSDSVPVLFVAPGLPLGHPSNGNGYLHEVRDQFRAMDSVVGHAQRVTSVAEIPLAVAQCFAAMATGRPRPAYLEIPLDLLDESAPVIPVAPVSPSIITPAPSLLDEAQALLGRSEQPLLIVGGGAAGAASEVRALAELLGAPVITTANGKGTLEESHPLALGAGLQHPSVAKLVADSDLVIAVGTELAPSDWWWGPIADTTLIRIDVDPTSVSTNARPTVAIVGDAAKSLAALTAAYTGAPRDGAARAQLWRERLQADARDEGARYVRLCRSLDAVLDDTAVLAADSAMACYYGALSNLPLHRPRSFLYPTGLGTLGYGLPAAIGAKVGAPERQVVAMLGDGGVMFTIAELAAAAEARLPIPVVIVDNGGYGEIRNEMVDRDDRVHAVDLGTPDFPALARALGCYGVAVGSSEEVGPAVAAALTADRPTLIHVREEEVEQ
ncbi:thiamine pyrophosphate-binding protein [Rhodococcus sp. TAF43]|uniref:thiamine pyrophosphate-binding protein n=1 Tax=unclassified Rhodococcus (in: high G+C Gram-positive bacteria) TaxID=192944 RepID=UPI001582EC1C|nr:5-guanidino-2-oxopentanoate decarboxylase [Rhodococcus sp. W8901]QKT09666.1 5-guanidino-2-oxopentanoate decarboxylase [Rhodococcus sp. W8901]